MSRRPAIVPAALSLGVLGLLATVATASTPAAAPVAQQAVISQPVAALAAVAAPTCSAPTLRPSTTKAADPTVRFAAQRGLDWLSEATVAWQDQHNCYGCHVQGVTVDALSVGHAKGYRVDERQLARVLAGVTDLPGGSRNPGGLSYHGGGLRLSSKSIGGAAFARFDAMVDHRLRDDLLTVAGELLEFQAQDGAVRDPEKWSNPPVGTGHPEQWTALAVTVWRQAYERSGDDRWLTAAATAEDWMAGRASKLTGAEDIQLVNYTLLVLLAGGAGAGESAVARVASVLEARQNEDGGWGLQGASDPLATGQTLTTLRQLGRTDADHAVARGTRWLVQHQLASGSWGTGGRGKAEAMWAVLGLVSVDVLTVEVAGIQHGQHVEGTVPVQVVAADNGGSGVRSVELFLDDVRVAAGCADRLNWTLSTANLPDGAHIVDVVATNADGESTRRRATVYAGDWYLTRPGTSWESSGTRVSVRNIAEQTKDTSIEVVIKAENSDDKLWSSTAPASQGAWSTVWSGEGAVPGQERYVAQLTLRDAAGKALHTIEERFVHAPAAQRQANYGAVAGRVNFADDEAEVANAVVELVDALGNVVESTRSTANGAYRFKDVAGGEYKVRVKKEGRATQEAPVMAAPAAESSADFDLE